MLFLGQGKDWWVASGYRALRTFLTTLVSYVLIGGGITDIDYLAAFSASLLAGVLAVATAFIDLPEVTDKTIPKWIALLVRAVKSFFQSFVALVPTSAIFLTDVNWTDVLNVSIGAAVGSLILGVVSVLPESIPSATPSVPEQAWTETDAKE